MGGSNVSNVRRFLVVRSVISAIKIHHNDPVLLMLFNKNHLSVFGHENISFRAEEPRRKKFVSMWQMKLIIGQRCEIEFTFANTVLTLHCCQRARSKPRQPREQVVSMLQVLARKKRKCAKSVKSFLVHHGVISNHTCCPTFSNTNPILSVSFHRAAEQKTGNN